jgi:hypothetical protein
MVQIQNNNNNKKLGMTSTEGRATETIIRNGTWEGWGETSEQVWVLKLFGLRNPLYSKK